MAQLAEQLICNQQVTGSSPVVGFLLKTNNTTCQCGGTGRRSGLKIRFSVESVGSSPIAGIAPDGAQK